MTIQLKKCLALHKERYPYNHDEDQIRSNFSDFKNADGDFDPICLKGKHWEIIKLDLIDFAKQVLFPPLSLYGIVLFDRRSTS